MKTIEIKGIIVPNDEKMIYEMFGYEVTTPDDVNEQLENAQNGEKLEVIINSPGGDVFSGSEIYTRIMDHNGSATTKIVGMAASAASVVGMAGGVTKMSPTAQMMIHNVSSTASGDYRTMDKTSDILKKANNTIVNAYILKSGMDRQALLDLMDEETWLSPQEAKDYGFVDEIMFDTGNKLAAVAGINGNILLPDEVVNKIRDSLHDGGIIDSETTNKKETKILKARLELLKLKGADVDVN